MATSIDIKTNVEVPDVDKSINQFKALKQSMRDAIGELAGLKEGTEEYLAAAEKVGDIKEQIKELQNAIKNTSAAPIENLTNSFGLFKDQVGTLNFKDATTSLKQFGSNVSGLNFKELGGDVKNFGSTVLSVGKSLLTNPLFLIPAIIVGLIASFVALKDKVAIIGEAFDFLGGIIDNITGAVKKFTDFIGLTNFAVTDAAEKNIAASKKTGDAIEERYDREIKYAKAAGKDTLDLEKQKGEAVRQNLLAQADAIAHLAAINGKFTDDQKKALDEIRKAYKSSRDEQTVSELEDTKKKSDASKKRHDETIAANKALLKQIADDRAAASIEAIKDDEARANAKAAADKEKRDRDIAASKASADIKHQALAASEGKFIADLGKIQDDFDQKRKAAAEKLAAEEKAIEEKRLKESNALEDKAVADLILREKKKAAALIDKTTDPKQKLKLQQKALDDQHDIEVQNANRTGADIEVIEAEYQDASVKLEQDAVQKELALQQQKKAAFVQIESQALNDAQGIADVYFQTKIQQAEGDAAKQLEIKKQQFEVDKAFSIAKAVINGFLGVTEALSKDDLLGAVVAGASAAVAIAKIASTQFNPGGGGGAGAASAGSIATVAAPRISSPTGGSSSPKFSAAAFTPSGTAIKQVQKQPQQKAVVVEASDIRRVMTKVDVTERRATFGQ